MKVAHFYSANSVATYLQQQTHERLRHRLKQISIMTDLIDRLNYMGAQVNGVKCVIIRCSDRLVLGMENLQASYTFTTKRGVICRVRSCSDCLIYID